MTIEELIKKLSDFPCDAEILVQGYEGGFDNVIKVKTQRVKRAENSQWYDGEFDPAEAADSWATDAVVVLGNRRSE